MFLYLIDSRKFKAQDLPINVNLEPFYLNKDCIGYIIELKITLTYIFLINTASAHFIPSIAAEIIPPAYPAPSPHG